MVAYWERGPLARILMDRTGGSGVSASTAACAWWPLPYPYPLPFLYGAQKRELREAKEYWQPPHAMVAQVQYVPNKKCRFLIRL